MTPMRILEELGREHELFKRLLRCLDGDLTREYPAFMPSARKSIAVLLPALLRHEETERILEAGSLGVRDPREAEIRRAIGLQHDALVAICRDLRIFLDRPEEYPPERTRTLGRLLADNLREHLRYEEKRLWPRLRRYWRSFPSGNSFALAEELRTLEEFVERLEGRRGKSVARKGARGGRAR